MIRAELALTSLPDQGQIRVEVLMTMESNLRARHHFQSKQRPQKPPNSYYFIQLTFVYVWECAFATEIHSVCTSFCLYGCVFMVTV